MCIIVRIGRAQLATNMQIGYAVFAWYSLVEYEMGGVLDLPDGKYEVSIGNSSVSLVLFVTVDVHIKF